MDFPFKVDYAPEIIQQRNSCNKCSKQFHAGQLRIAVMVQSDTDDIKVENWYDKNCFFSSGVFFLPQSRDDIQNFESLKYDDQVSILMIIEPNSIPTLKKVADKRAAKKPRDCNDITNFGIEYSTSNDSPCFYCKEVITRNEIRIKKIVHDSKIALQFGKEIRWHHLDCFIMQRETYGFVVSGYQLPGFKTLQADHRKYVSDTLPSLVEVELVDLDSSYDDEDLPKTDIGLEEKIAKQTAELVRVRQALEKVCSIEQLQHLLTNNDSDASQNKEVLLERCADFLTFGSLYKCQKCFKGDMVFNKNGYICSAMVDDWVKCGFFDAMPLRMKCFIPKELKHLDFFATCEPRIEHRAVRPTLPKQEGEGSYAMEAPDDNKNKITKLVLKNGTAVDPQSGLDKQSHVYKQNGKFYTCVLGLTDIERNKNSYYKLQLLESDKAPKNFWVFSSWGRIGTNIGDSLVDPPFKSANLACTRFEQLYFQQTGNNWKTSEQFKKNPGKFYPIEITYGDDINANTSIMCELTPALEELMKIIFNVQAMTTALKEFHLDLEKMPLGKLSAKQIQMAYLALAEVETAILNEHREAIIGLSNKFYTLIPHNFGLQKAPALDSVESLNEKREMLDSLLDIGNAYQMMTQANANNDVNSFDAYYKQLKSKIEVLDKASDEFKLIEKYVANTAVHGYKVQLQEVFKVEREGEKQRYAPFKNLHNRQLLWHGSSVTNFASIISNGLRIQQQVFGSMFGRGIYFADMMSKSMNYCRNINGMLTRNSIVLLALSEVALGTMYQPGAAQNIAALPAGYHSTKGVGITVPDPNKNYVRPDGVIIPLGVPINNNPTTTGLLFNEFIVYNEAQVNIQYLVQAKII